MPYLFLLKYWKALPVSHQVPYIFLIGKVIVENNFHIYRKLFVTLMNNGHL
ncbi:hypothetical protein Xets_02578 [Xenorhabdus sp. TS4]|nr:hypothetical protein [Xenorhabdus sp. TS4]